MKIRSVEYNKTVKIVTNQLNLKESSYVNKAIFDNNINP